MPDIFYLISRWWKQMLITGVICLGAVALIVFLQPRLYLSVATALPASSVLADKGAIFNENIEGLYSNIGSPEDLNRIIGTAELDTIYLAVAAEFNLEDHYKLSKKNEPRIKAARELKKSSEVIKSEYGELKVKVWDTDKKLAPQLANSIMNKLAVMYQELQNWNNYASVKSLQSGKEKILSEMDSIKSYLARISLPANMPDPYTTRLNVLAEQLAKYEKLLIEYQLMIDNKPAVLMVVENAKPAIRPDKPKRLQLMIAAAFASLLFALLVAVIMQRKSEGT
jgi:hypothetical protein